jgi:hypothetical protein
MDEKDFNWIDPDTLEDDSVSDIASTDNRGKQRQFKEFFETGWLDPVYDHLRDHWDPLLKDEDPYGRMFAKTALWSLVRLRNFKGEFD